MPTLHYYHVDVFTDRLFGGNQLAVFTDGRGLSTETMQHIAREMNFSETTFVLPPQDAQNHFWVRIFTPTTELPTAGHPTVGTAFVLHKAGMVALAQAEQTVRFEEAVGIIPVTYYQREQATPLSFMSQPLSKFGSIFENRMVLAEMLSIGTDGLHPTYPAQMVSSGVPFLFVVVNDLATLGKVKLRLDLWERYLKEWEAPQVFVFTPDGTVNEMSAVRSRMFSPAFGIAEDPATGIASGPLACYLLKYGLVPAGAQVAILNQQGFEMGRPSFIYIRVEMQGSEVSRLLVGGETVYVGEGTLHI